MGTQVEERAQKLGRRALGAAGALAALFGLAFFARALVEADLAAFWRDTPAILWASAVLSVLSIALGTLSWRAAIPAARAEEGGREPSLGLLFGARLAGEAINNALASAYVAGEPAKAAIVARAGLAPARAFASVLIGKTSFILGEVAFLAIGVACAAARFGPRDAVVRWLALVALAGLTVALAAIAVQIARPIGRGARLLSDLRVGSAAFWERARPAADAVDRAVRDYWQSERPAFARSTALATLGWIAGALELWAWLALASSDPEPWRTALAIEAGIAVAKGVSFMVPGSLGVQEGGIAWLFASAGLSAELGVGYALFRRLREALWIAAGFACLSAYGARSARGGVRRVRAGSAEERHPS